MIIILDNLVNNYLNILSCLILINIFNFNREKFIIILILDIFLNKTPIITIIILILYFLNKSVFKKIINNNFNKFIFIILYYFIFISLLYSINDYSFSYIYYNKTYLLSHIYNILIYYIYIFYR